MMIILKLALAFFSWEPILKLLLQFAFSYLTELLEKSELSLKQKMFVQDMDAINRTLGMRWAGETKSGVDDELVNNIISLCESVAITHNFHLHILGQIE